MLSVTPLVFAEDDDDSGGIDIIIDEPDNECPEIYQDATQRSWYPNDQTIYTATEYGSSDTNVYGDAYFDVEDRGNYVFQGETLTYYVIVEDANGDDDIGAVRIDGFGACLEIDVPTSVPSPYATWGDYAVAKFGISAWDDATMNLYKCKLIVPGSISALQTITIEAEDEDNSECVVTEEKEDIVFNPSVSVMLDGTINFGNVQAGAVATSNAIQIQNDGAVLVDVYIASDDYFTAPSDEDAICGDGNGIKYDQFSYYATKGSVDSGSNDNVYPGIGETSGICVASADEYTKMPSHSGHIEDMCRVINHLQKGSFVIPGDFMSLKLRLDVPDNCEPASYTDGQFHVVGRVI